MKEEMREELLVIAKEGIGLVNSLRKSRVLMKEEKLDRLGDILSVIANEMKK